MAMDGFEREALSRLPLAEGALTLLQWVLDEALLKQLFEEHRGTGCERTVTFPGLVSLLREALMEHRGSGRQAFEAARLGGRVKATNAALYGKLRRLPLSLSEAFLSACTERLRQVLPEGAGNPVPPALQGHRIVVVDGKKIKNLPKRLQGLRSLKGKALGGKAVAALLLNEGLVVAMEVSPDGEANDAPLTPGLLAQVSAQFPEPVLYVADRQFCDLTIPRAIEARQQAFLIRYSRRMKFYAERESVRPDAPGPVIREAWGCVGGPRNKRRMFVRQITLERPGEEAIVLLTDLLDSDQFPADQLLEVYRQRWSIERVFQQVTEVFHLEQLISSSPQGALFQFALCALLYNVLQVLRGYIAQAHARPDKDLSSEMIFRGLCDQLTASVVLIDQARLLGALGPPRSAAAVRFRLTELLHECWSPLWPKSKAKNKPPPRTQQSVKGGHWSAWKVLQNAKAKPQPLLR
jgi:hypothetical protein